MRKKSVAAVAGLALAAVAGPMGSAASAAPECVGVMSFRDTYVCVVRFERPGAQILPGPAVLVPEVCVTSVLCTDEAWVFLPDLALDGGLVVLYYDGECHYVEDGAVRSVAAANEHGCP